MILKDSLQLMIENLSEQTTNNRLNWIPKNDTTMVTEIEDTKFDFHINWELKIDSGWTMSNCWINMKSADLELTIYEHNFKESMTAMKNHLCEFHFNNRKPSDQKVIDKIENISKKLSIQEYRDKKISNLFGFL
jgi:hypothetical protein